ncbi:hypothetical protein [Hymenobacter sp. IS2118]|uniref:hypothetical protein n=1 Tax=Hymenobacter sp. IS2118 TaxID=1505605 RepID=UPI001267BF18|nr:hypothetical protein [Hymenobacter sp. IS2118]
MLNSLLLDETSPITFGLWLFGIPAMGIYIGFLVLLLNRKSYTWRIIGFIIAIAIALFGLFLYEDLTWVISPFVFAPLLFGIYGVYFLPRKATS